MSTFQLDVITGAVDIDDTELCRIIQKRGVVYVYTLAEATS